MYGEKVIPDEARLSDVIYSMRPDSLKIVSILVKGQTVWIPVYVGITQVTLTRRRPDYLMLHVWRLQSNLDVDNVKWSDRTNSRSPRNHVNDVDTVRGQTLWSWLGEDYISILTSMTWNGQTVPIQVYVRTTQGLDDEKDFHFFVSRLSWNTMWFYVCVYTEKT